jgi:polyhydroxyalkanoate synthase
MSGATEHSGSWWPDWRAWIEGLDAETVPARSAGASMTILEEAPGSYVRMRA